MTVPIGATPPENTPPEPQTPPENQTPSDHQTGNKAVVDSRTADLVAGPGGVMTVDVGVITGDLTLRTELSANGDVILRVQYKDADEWYTVQGGTAHLAAPADLDAVHTIALGILNRPSG